jgi:hypothetical protein
LQSIRRDRQRKRGTRGASDERLSRVTDARVSPWRRPGE